MRDVSSGRRRRDVFERGCRGEVLSVAAAVEEDFGGTAEVGLVPVQERLAGGRGAGVFVDEEDHVVDCAGCILGPVDGGFFEDVCVLLLAVAHSVGEVVTV